MLVRDAELTPHGQAFMEINADCVYCGRSLVTRFGGLPDTNECPSCYSDFKRLQDADKLRLE